MIQILSSMRSRILLAVAFAAFLGAAVLGIHPAQAYTYNSYTVDDLNVTNTSTSAGSSTDITVTFTMPTAMSTSGYLYVSTPYLYSYSGGTYSSDYVDLTNATITSSQLTVSYKGSTYVSLYPTANLADNAAVTITISGATNPTTLEGTGSFYVSGYESSTDVYTSFYGSVSQVYGEVDLTVNMKDTDGTTGVSNVSVYLSYYNQSNYNDYQYLYGTTNSSGQVQFTGLVASRAYSVSFYYSGTVTDNDPPASKTYTHNGTAGQSVTYTFLGSNVLTHFKDASGNAVNNAYWYFYKTNYSNYSTDYVWRYGYTDSTGKIAGSADVDGSYSLYVADANYNYYQYDFTVTAGVESGLADPISIPTAEVTGTVTAGGSAVSNAYVTIHNADWTRYRGAYTTSSGAFTFALGATDSYKIEVSSYGLPSGYFATDPVTVSVTAGTANSALTLELQSATKTISGTITKAADSAARVTAGTPVTDATVYAYQSTGSYGYASTTVDSSGRFTLPVTGSKWTVYIYQNSWPATWAYTGGSLTASFASDSTSETATFNIEVLPYNSYITGHVEYPSGTTVGSSDVYVYGYGGENNSVYSYAYTDSSGNFTLNTTAGTFSIYMYFYSSSGATNYAVPTIDAVTVESGATYALGTITLLEKNSKIGGNISISDTSEAVSGQYVYAYREGTWDWASDTTDTDGNYELFVTPGNWSVYTYTWGVTTSTGKNVINTNSSQSVVVAENETVTGIDFPLQIADATINFVVQDTAGTTLDDQYGWASISEDNTDGSDYYSTGCYVSRGECSLAVGSDTAYFVNFYTYSNWGWGSEDDETYTYDHLAVNGTAAASVTVASGDTAEAGLVMAVNDVTISGNFLNDQNEETDISGEVYATNENGGWAYTYISDTSSYELKLAAGSWKVNYYTWGNWTRQDNSSAGQTVVVESGDSVDLDFYVLDNGATISGTVTDGDGNPVTTVTFVKASTSYGTSETETGETYGLIEQTTYTDESGNFSMNVPAGEYYITASAPGSLDPQPIKVTADTAGSAEGLTLAFVSSTSTISGTVTDGVGITVNNRRSSALGDGVSDAFIYAYTRSGSAVNTTSDSAGAYSLPATTGETWYVGAIFEAENVAHYSELEAVSVTESTTTLNLQLTQTLELPAPQTVQFDPNDASVMSLEDGTTVNMPANSITSEDLSQVSVVATPTAEVSHEPEESPLSIGYVFSALDDTGSPISEFADNVTITVPYDEADLEEAGITDENDLSMGYYSASADEWQSVDGGVVLDTDANTFTATVDHFSTFAVMSSSSVLAGGSNVDEDSDTGDDTGGDADTGDDVDTTPDLEADGILDTPTDVQATSRKAKQIMVDWVGDSDAASYEVEVVNVQTSEVVKTVTATNSQKKVKKLQSNKKYSFRVRAVGSTGSMSTYSDSKVLRTIPAAPKKLAVTLPDTTGTTVSWAASRGTIKNYTVSVFKGDTRVMKKTLKKRSYAVTNLDPNTAYYFRVKARFNKNNVSAFSVKKHFTTAAQ